MNSTTLFALLLGHLFGDYLTQNAWMAFNKKLHSELGELACLTHCFIYTNMVMIFLFISKSLQVFQIDQQVGIWIFIFLSHYIIDRGHFVEWWLSFIKARSWDTHIDLNVPALSTKESMFLSFGAIVYVVADNTLHLTLMFFILLFYLGI